MGSFFITLREGFEAALIVGLILAFLKKTGSLEDHRRSVWLGVGAGIALSCVIGLTLFLAVGELEGTAEQLYEGTAMLLAAGVVTWMVFWMRKQAATIGEHLRVQVSDSLRTGGGLALAAVAFIGVAREGLETALFLFASVGESGALVTVAAAVAGLIAAIALGVLVYRGALRLDLRKFFTITGVLVIAFAAVLIQGALHELGEFFESEFLETAGPALALVYAAGFGFVYLRGLRVAPPPASAPAHSQG
jgi:high-affinity iron transporter